MCACVRARVAPGRGAGGAEGCPNDTAAMVQGRQEGSQCRGSRRGLLPSAPGPCAPLPCSTGAQQGRERSASGLQPPPGFTAMRQATGRAWGLAHIRLLEHVLHRLASLHADPRLPLALQQLAVVPAPRVGGGGMPACSHPARPIVSSGQTWTAQQPAAFWVPASGGCDVCQRVAEPTQGTGFVPPASSKGACSAGTQPGTRRVCPPANPAVTLAAHSPHVLLQELVGVWVVVHQIALVALHHHASIGGADAPRTHDAHRLVLQVKGGGGTRQGRLCLHLVPKAPCAEHGAWRRPPTSRAYCFWLSRRDRQAAGVMGRELASRDDDGGVGQAGSAPAAGCPQTGWAASPCSARRA